MIRKLMCWLGWHEWVDYTLTIPNGEYFILIKKACKRCIHSGKVKE